PPGNHYSFLSSPASARTAPSTLSLHDALPICRSQRGIAIVGGDHRIGPVLQQDLQQFEVSGLRCSHKRCRSCLKKPLHCENSSRSEEHTSELQSRFDVVCRLLLEKKNLR